MKAHISQLFEIYSKFTQLFGTPNSVFVKLQSKFEKWCESVITQFLLSRSFLI